MRWLIFYFAVKMNSSPVPTMSVPAPVNIKPVTPLTGVPPPSDACCPRPVVNAVALSQQCHDRLFWVFGIILLIAIVLILWLFSCGNEWFRGLNNNWGGGCASGIGVFILIIVLLLMTYFAYVAFRACRNSCILGLYFVTVVLLVWWFFAMFKCQSLKRARLAGVLLFIAALLLSVWVWRVDCRAGAGTLPFLLWVGLIVVWGWNLHRNNNCE